MSNNTKARKKRRLKKMTRVHILPHLFLLLISIIIFIVMISASSMAFLAYVVDQKVDGISNSAKAFADSMETQKIYGRRLTEEEFIANATSPTSAFCIYDAEGKCVLSNSEEKLLLDDLVKYPDPENRNLYFRKDKIDSKYIEGDDFDFASILKDSISFSMYGDGEFSDFSTMMQKAVVSIPVCVKISIWDNQYDLYYLGNLEIKSKDGIYVFAIFVVAIIMASLPLLLYIITLIMSIVGQRRSAKILYYDPITGGKNWIYFEEKVEAFLRRNKKKKKFDYAMVDVRLDKYQAYCMCYGSDEGEALLQRLYMVFARNMQKKEVFSRYTEAEFGALLKYTSEDELTEHVSRLIKELSACAGERKLDFSCGICASEQIREMDVLFSNASIARKNISADNLSRVAWFNEKLKSDKLWEKHVEENMEHALENGEFQVYLQPKYNASTRELGGAEALIRWISPTEGFIGPGKFIPIFEENGFITKIDDFMIKQVSMLQAKWIAEGRKIVPVSVNVSRAHFTREDLAEHICRIVDETGAPRSCIELELTESAFFQDREVLVNTVKKMRDYGFSVSMDDFGADYSSLNSLKDMPMDVIKLDAGFFRGNEDSEERGDVIVDEVIKLAKNLDMKIVAEGIETERYVNFLAERGCDLIQGFYFAKPMPVSEFEAL